MTTYSSKNVNCAHCGRGSEQTGLTSTNAFGSADLDLRPPEMQRSTMSVWLQECPNCGYVAYNLAQKSAGMSMVGGKLYNGWREDRRFPSLARRFLAHAQLFVESDPRLASHSQLCAAWICDDARYTIPARECRLLAATSMARLQPFENSEEGITVGAVYVDILRRAGEFPQAAQEVQILTRLSHCRGALREVLDFQEQLIKKQTTAAYKISDCVSENGN